MDENTLTRIAFRIPAAMLHGPMRCFARQFDGHRARRAAPSIARLHAAARSRGSARFRCCAAWARAPATRGVSWTDRAVHAADPFARRHGRAEAEHRVETRDSTRMLFPAQDRWAAAPRS